MADNNYVWIVTSYPNQVHCISLLDSSFKKTYNLDFNPIKIVYNYFNNRLYILTESGDFLNSKYISVMNPETGVIEKKIEVKPDKYDHPQAQDVYATDIAFGANGYGVFLMSAYGSSSQRWKVIDSRANDSISIHPAWHSDNNYFTSFASVQPNFDGSKLVLQYNYGISRVGLLDCQSTEIQEIIPIASGSNSFVKPSKVNDDIYFANLYNQFIHYSNGSESIESELDARFLYSTSAEFNYKMDGSGIIYWLNDYNLLILNYNIQQVVFSHRKFYDLSSISGTSDGNFLLARREHGIYIFGTDMFYY